MPFTRTSFMGNPQRLSAATGGHYGMIAPD